MQCWFISYIITTRWTIKATLTNEGKVFKVILKNDGWFSRFILNPHTITEITVHQRSCSVSYLCCHLSRRAEKGEWTLLKPYEQRPVSACSVVNYFQRWMFTPDGRFRGRCSVKVKTGSCITPTHTVHIVHLQPGLITYKLNANTHWLININVVTLWTCLTIYRSWMLTQVFSVVLLIK